MLYRENRALQFNLPQRMRRSETLCLQAAQPGVILFPPLQNKGIDQAVKIAVNGEDPPADNVALRIVALAVDDRRNPQALLVQLRMRALNIVATQRHSIQRFIIRQQPRRIPGE